MTIQDYLNNINQRYQLGNATEHTYRGDLQNLLESLVPEIRATNEPKRQKCGAPDYILTKKDIGVGYIEAKNIGDKDLAGKKKTGNKEQFDRYKASLHNLIFTDYVSFHFYRYDEFVSQITIAEITEKGIKAIPEKFEEFIHLIKDFCTHVGQTITSSQKLAQMMAGKARLLSDVIEKSLVSDSESFEDSTLKEQMEAFKRILIHDITPKGFADVYAQTITYGLFAARLQAPTLETFSRQEAATLIPKTNPFLRKLFGYIAGIDIDERILWMVEDLVEIFLASNVEELLQNYGKSTQMEDPIIHFYEDFLAEYDPKLRQSRGVWYTPAPVVNFIVRAVDNILKTEFGLTQGLADTSKIERNSGKQGTENSSQPTPIHKVQILDPATGTGTFLAEVVKYIHQKFKGQEGIWTDYVAKDLIPRLNGFELLMASYAMAHLQLDLLLRQTGFESRSSQRLRVFLTNSLEEYHSDTGTLFASWLSAEANEANHIKRDTPVMCIIGNPPYAGESANKGDWIMNLMEDYKKEPEGKQKLQERNPKWINDDYVKFMRYGQYFIEKNGSGVLAFINPHGFLDNPTFRGMRWNLLKTYDKIYTIDLHGNSKKKEIAPDGSLDQNVFDIMQGVSINIFIKTGKKKENELGKVFHYDLYGKREEKYKFLNNHSIKSVQYKKLPNIAPNYFFVPKDFEAQKKYDKGFGVHELFTLNSVGIVTSRDSFVIDEDKAILKDKINDFFELSKYELQEKYGLRENKSWKIDEVKLKAKTFKSEAITTISYRPFDKRFIYYDNNFVERSRIEVMQHLFNGNNLGITLCKQFKSGNTYQHIFISDKIIESSLVSNKTSEITTTFPLYLYPNINLEKDYQQELEGLKLQYEESQIIAENFEKTLSKVQKMYVNSQNPDKELKQYYESQKKHYDKLTKAVQKYKQRLHDKQSQNIFKEDENKRIPNLNSKIVAEIAKQLNLTFTPEKENTPPLGEIGGYFAPIDILDYIYAVLHSPTYRDKYKEFLKIDFPRVPYPAPPQPSPKEREKAREKFWKLVKLGGEIRQIHLLESPKVEDYITTFPKSGTNEITNKLNKKDWELTDKKKQLGRIWLNEEQYFDNIPLVAWEFYIGGYQPAQKWLKDRRGRTLDFEDILHYQKIIVALNETDRLMTEIDEIIGD